MPYKYIFFKKRHFSGVKCRLENTTICNFQSVLFQSLKKQTNRQPLIIYIFICSFSFVLVLKTKLGYYLVSWVIIWSVRLIQIHYFYSEVTFPYPLYHHILELKTKTKKNCFFSFFKQRHFLPQIFKHFPSICNN